MVKILHTADLHLGEDLFNTLESRAAEERYKDALDSLNQVRDIALGKEADAVIIAGDIFNRALPSGTTSLKFSEFLKDLLDNRIHVVILRGNHDRPAIEGASELLKTYRILLSKKQENYFHYLSKIDTANIVAKDKKTVAFVGLPYYPIGAEYEDAENLEEVLKKSNEIQSQRSTDAFKRAILDRVIRERSKTGADFHILVAHIPIAGSISGSERIFYRSKSEIIYEANEICRLPFDYIALGHFHVMQTVGAPNCRYSGSIFRLTFDEPSYIDGRKVSKSEKGIILVEEEEGKLNPKPIPINTRDLCVVNLNYLSPSLNPVLGNVDEIVAKVSEKCPIVDIRKPPLIKVIAKIVDTQRRMFDEYTIRRMLLQVGYLDVKFDVKTEQTTVPQVKTSSLPVEESLTKYVESLQIPQDIKEEVVDEALKIIREAREK
ncbi:MAG: metallophosphoesterase family protein [Nitrososphaeria archaeon]